MHSEPPPLVLGFDTSAAQCAAALVSGERLLVRRVEPMARGQAERLLPMLEEVLAEGGTDWAGLAALAVCTGPGNFTGIRVGVAAARGLALALGIPAIGLTQFELRSSVAPERRFFTVPAQGRLFRQLMRNGEALAPPEALEADHGYPDAGASELLDPVWVARCGAERLAAGRAAAGARPAPFYLREADAAPSAEPPPLILDG